MLFWISLYENLELDLEGNKYFRASTLQKMQFSGRYCSVDGFWKFLGKTKMFQHMLLDNVDLNILLIFLSKKPFFPFYMNTIYL